MQETSLAFDMDFFLFRGFGAGIWASDEADRRLRFRLSTEILADIFKVTSPINENAVRAACDRNRQKIETACYRALRREPGTQIESELSTLRLDR